MLRNKLFMGLGKNMYTKNRKLWRKIWHRRNTNEKEKNKNRNRKNWRKPKITAQNLSLCYGDCLTQLSACCHMTFSSGVP